MKRPFSKKRFWLMITILAIIEITVLCLVMRWKYIFPTDEVSELYTRYEKVEGIEVSFIKDYKVNDTVLVDVTLLDAKTDSAWEILLYDFNLETPPQEMIDFIGCNFIEIWIAPKRDYSLPADTILLNNDLLAISWDEQRISIFSIETEQQMYLMKRHMAEESISKSQK